MLLEQEKFMHFGIEVVPFGEYSDPRNIITLAKAAETAGWEAIWLWDHILFPWGVSDPWITLAAIAAGTSSIKLLTGVAPIPRYRPHLLARMLASLDLLSQGRVIFGAGLGVEFEFTPFGEPADDRTRAEMTDEGLTLLAKFLTGEKFTHKGKYYTAINVNLSPGSFQKPRIPIWIGGESFHALRRAAHWDGWIVGTVNEQMEITITPAQVAGRVQKIKAQRPLAQPFDIAVDGISKSGETGLAGEYSDAGATWWFECLFGNRGSMDAMIDRINAGPPK